MPTMRRTRCRVNLGHTDRTELPGRDRYRHLAKGDEFTVAGEGRYRLVAVRANGELNAWGPLNGKAPRMRTFTVDRVDTVHRKKTV